MSAAEWIAKRRDLLAAATEGPWDCYRPHPNYITRGLWVQLVGPEPGATHPRTKP